MPDNELRCPQCGAGNEHNSYFCQRCGASLTSAAGPWSTPSDTGPVPSAWSPPSSTPGPSPDPSPPAWSSSSYSSGPSPNPSPPASPYPPSPNAAPLPSAWAAPQPAYPPPPLGTGSATPFATGTCPRCGTATFPNWTVCHNCGYAPATPQMAAPPMTAAPRSDRGVLVGCSVAGVVGILLVGLLGVLGWMFYRATGNQASAPRTATALARAVQVPVSTRVPATATKRGAATATSIVLVFPTIPTQAPSDDPASVPRMPLAAFKKLYDDPTTRPLILDVRSKDTYDAGHIEGAISFPEADMDSRVAELPKDTLIIAYCQ